MARGCGICLAETLENMWKKFRLDADSGVLDDDLHVGVDSLENHLDTAPGRGEFHRIAEQVPQDLLQPVGVAPHQADTGIE